MAFKTFSILSIFKRRERKSIFIPSNFCHMCVFFINSVASMRNSLYSLSPHNRKLSPIPTFFLTTLPHPALTQAKTLYWCRVYTYCQNYRPKTQKDERRNRNQGTKHPSNKDKRRKQHLDLKSSQIQMNKNTVTPRAICHCWSPALLPQQALNILA